MHNLNLGLNKVTNHMSWAVKLTLKWSNLSPLNLAMSLLCHIHGEIGFYTMLNSDSIFKSSDNSKFSLIPDKK